MTLRFEQLQSLHWLWAVLACGGLLLLAIARRRALLLRIAAEPLLARLVASPGAGRLIVRCVLLLAVLLLLVVALMDPRWGFTYRPVQQRGVDVVILLDVSRSMLAEDVRPNRLERGRQYIRDLVEELSGDRVALITFAGTATLRCPLTVDYGAFLMTLDTVVAEHGGRGGSLLGDALRRAADAFTDEDPEHKVIIVFSDGEDHGSYPLEAVRNMRDKWPVPVYTVGLGDAQEGQRIPVEADGTRSWLMHEGQQVWTKMNAEELRAIAIASGGAWVPAGTAAVDMGRVYAERIEPASKKAFDETEVRRSTPRYQWFAGLALALLLVESFMSDRGQRRSEAP